MEENYENYGKILETESNLKTPLINDLSKTKYNTKEDSDYSEDLDNSFIEDFNSFSKLSIKLSFDLNQTSNKDKDNSILMIKENKLFPNEFLVANSDFSLNYYRITESNVCLLNSFNEHVGRINDVTFFNTNQNPYQNCFCTASSDCSLKIWDFRSKDSAHTLKSKNNKEYFSLATVNDILIAGNGSELQLRDLSRLDKFQQKKNSHSNDITSVKLKYSNFGTILMTGSEDNLINIYNINKEDKFQEVFPEVTLNTNQPVSKCNFLDESINFIDVVTSINSYHILDQNSREVFCYNAMNDIYKSEFIIESFFSPKDNFVELFCGNNSGDIVLMKVLLESNPTISFDSILSTNYTQSITNISKLNEKILLATSDIGHLYIIENGDNYFESINLLYEKKETIHTQKKISSKDDNAVSNKNKNQKLRMNLFSPY